MVVKKNRKKVVRKKVVKCSGQKLQKGANGGMYYITKGGYKKYCKTAPRNRVIKQKKEKKEKPEKKILRRKKKPIAPQPLLIPSGSVVPLVPYLSEQTQKQQPKNVLNRDFPLEKFQKVFKDKIEDFSEMKGSDLLGEGVDGKVYKATYHGTNPMIPKNEFVAVKFFNSRSDMEPYVMSKIMKNNALRTSKYLIPIYGGGIYISGINRNKKPFLVYKLMTEGTLFDFAQKYNWNVPNQIVYNVMVDIIYGVHLLHKNKIAHTDMHANNIFVSNEHGIIGDFGRACTSDKIIPCGGNAKLLDYQQIVHALHLMTLKNDSKFGNSMKQLVDYWDIDRISKDGVLSMKENLDEQIYQM